MAKKSHNKMDEIIEACGDDESLEVVKAVALKARETPEGVKFFGVPVVISTDLPWGGELVLVWHERTSPEVSPLPASPWVVWDEGMEDRCDHEFEYDIDENTYECTLCGHRQENS